MVADSDGLHLSRLREAINAGRKATIIYRAGSATVGAERSVHPYGLVHDKRWYLVAYCEKASAIRIFRLDRMLGVTVLAEPADIPDGVALEETLHHGRALTSQAEEHLRVHYSAAIARWITEHETAQAQDDGSVIVDHPLLDDEWAVRHVLQYGPDAVVLEPARVRALVAERLAAIIA
jgi:proteasome accessory factor C